MKSWKPARILYLILAIMLTFSVVPFIPFSINMTLATEGRLTTFNIIFFLYDAIGLLIALTILTRTRRDHYKPTGAFLGFATYALALLGHFLFYRYGQESLYFSHFFQSPVAEQLFRLIVILAVLTWLFNVMALLMSYIEVFDIRNAARALKDDQLDEQPQETMGTQKKVRKVRNVTDYKNIDPKDHVDEGSAVSHEYADPTAEARQQYEPVKVTAERVRRGVVVNKSGQDYEDESINITIEGINLSQIKGIAIDVAAGDVKGKPLQKATEKKKKATASRENKEDMSGQTEHVRDGYIAQLTGDLFVDDSTSGKKTKGRKIRTKATEKRDRKVKAITADMLDDFDDDE